VCSPQTWGWTVRFTHSTKLPIVFPTDVGMDRFSELPNAQYLSVPHRRGDGPVEFIQGRSVTSCSPQTWGWTEYFGTTGSDITVFPTDVGMDRRKKCQEQRVNSVPHRRGDGPFDR